MIRLHTYMYNPGRLPLLDVNMVVSCFLFISPIIIVELLQLNALKGSEPILSIVYIIVNPFTLTISSY